MSIFYIIVALLLAGALLFLLPPLLRGERTASDSESAMRLPYYREQLADLEAEQAAGTISAEKFAESKTELERRVLEEHRVQQASSATETSKGKRWLIPIVLAALIPAGAIALYAVIGTPGVVTGKPKDIPSDLKDVTPAQFALMVQAVASHLRKNPEDAKAWPMLARSYHALGRTNDSLQAYRRAVLVAPNDADLLTEYANALAESRNGNFDGEPAQLLEQALQINPRSLRTLALAGAVAFDRKDYSAAIDFWERLKKEVPADSPATPEVDRSIAQARAAMAGSVAPAAPSSSGAQVSGTVSISPALKDKIADADTLFIYARADRGPRMPVAIIRATAKELPKAFTLDDSLAMAPTMKLSNFTNVVVEARVSKSGTAMPQAGDLVATATLVKVGSKDIQLVIDRVKE